MNWTSAFFRHCSSEFCRRNEVTQVWSDMRASKRSCVMLMKSGALHYSATPSTALAERPHAFIFCTITHLKPPWARPVAVLTDTMSDGGEHRPAALIYYTDCKCCLCITGNNGLYIHEDKNRWRVKWGNDSCVFASAWRGREVYMFYLRHNPVHQGTRLVLDVGNKWKTSCDIISNV